MSFKNKIGNKISRLQTSFQIRKRGNKQTYKKKIINKYVNMYAINLIAQYVIVYNVGFAAFNLLPNPPLDGWGVISSFVPYKYNDVVYKYESMSSIIFLVLILTGAYSIFVSPIINLIFSFFTICFTSSKSLKCIILLFIFI